MRTELQNTRARIGTHLCQESLLAFMMSVLFTRLTGPAEGQHRLLPDPSNQPGYLLPGRCRYQIQVKYYQNIEPEHNSE